MLALRILLLTLAVGLVHAQEDSVDYSEPSGTVNPNSEESHFVEKRSAKGDIVAIKNRRHPKFDCENDKMSNSLRQLFLNAQNDARMTVSKGYEGGLKGLLPKARNMYQLKWSCEMEHRAQAWVDKCEWMEDRRIRKEAQNYVFINDFGAGSNIRDAVVKTLENWRGEITKAAIEDDLTFNTALNIVNWSNMMYATSTEVGCAVARCSDKLAITCFYEKAGDVADQQIYEPGAPCQLDSDCDSYEGSHCVPGEGLCYYDPDAEISTFESERTSRICSTSPRMSDASRSTIIDWHNALRSSLVRGDQENGQGGYSPMGQKMLKMHYDCSLERSAQDTADICKFKATRNGKGENMFVTLLEHTKHDQISLLQQAVAEWWSELRNEGVNTNNTFTPAMAIHRQTHYSQMAWSQSFRLGCATKVCGEKYFVVCHYSPAGNGFKRVIYEKGFPCTQDANCDRGQRCSLYEGLCVVDVE